MTVHLLPNEKKKFSLEEANELLPLIRRITEATANQVNQLAEKMDGLNEDDPRFIEVSDKVDIHVKKWIDKMQKLGCEAKGLWLVDFDNGQGYYCWTWPEEQVDHYHGYDEGFQGRLRIC